MAEAKTGALRNKVKTTSDVLPRYLQGSMYTTCLMRRNNAGAGKKGGLGKQKISHISDTACDEKGWVK